MPAMDLAYPEKVIKWGKKIISYFGLKQHIYLIKQGSDVRADH